MNKKYIFNIAIFLQTVFTGGDKRENYLQNNFLAIVMNKNIEKISFNQTSLSRSMNWMALTKLLTKKSGSNIDKKTQKLIDNLVKKKKR